jgi:hypothetical protein
MSDIDPYQGDVYVPTGLLSPSQVSKQLGVSLATLKLWRLKGVGPPAMKISPRVTRYLAERVEQYIWHCEERAEERQKELQAKQAEKTKPRAKAAPKKLKSKNRGQQ